jgi:hypothetical protein
MIFGPCLHAEGFRQAEVVKSVQKCVEHLSSSESAQDGGRKRKRGPGMDLTVIAAICDNFLRGHQCSPASTKDLTLERPNYERLRLTAQSVAQAFVNVKGKLTVGSSLARYLYKYLDEELCGVWILPYREIVLKGDLRPFLNTFPNQVKLFGLYRRPRILPVCVHLLSNLIRWSLRRPDILELLGQNCKALLDVHIEHANSRLSRTLTSDKTYKRAKLVSATLQPSRRTVDDVQDTLGLQKAKTECEIVATELRCNEPAIAKHLPQSSSCWSQCSITHHERA